MAKLAASGVDVHLLWVQISMYCRETDEIVSAVKYRFKAHAKEALRLARRAKALRKAIAEFENERCKEDEHFHDPVLACVPIMLKVLEEWGYEAGAVYRKFSSVRDNPRLYHLGWVVDELRRQTGKPHIGKIVKLVNAVYKASGRSLVVEETQVRRNLRNFDRRHPGFKQLCTTRGIEHASSSTRGFSKNARDAFMAIVSRKYLVHRRRGLHGKC